MKKIANRCFVLAMLLVLSCKAPKTDDIHIHQRSLSEFHDQVSYINYFIKFHSNHTDFTGILYRNGQGCFLMAPEPFFNSNVWINIEILPEGFYSGGLEYHSYKTLGADEDINQSRRIEVVSYTIDNKVGDTTYVIDYYFYDFPTFKGAGVLNLLVDSVDADLISSFQVRLQLKLPSMQLKVLSFDERMLSKFICPFFSSNRLYIDY